MDEALAAIYDETSGEQTAWPAAALGLASAPNLAKWLGDIRNYLRKTSSPSSKRCHRKEGADAALFEPEMLKSVEPNPQLVGTLMS